MAKAKKSVKGTSLAKMIASAIENLTSTVAKGEMAANTLSSQRKKLVAESKRFSKKRASLSKQKKAAAKRLKKTPNAVLRKALGALSKQLAVVKKAGDKARSAASMNAAELNSVKAALKQSSVYMAAIEKADKKLNKPKKKKKRRAKRVVAMVEG